MQAENQFLLVGNYMVGISKFLFSLLIHQIVTNLKNPDLKNIDKLDISKIKAALEEGIMRIPNLEYSWGEHIGRISERLIDICFILIHLEKNMPVALKTLFDAHMTDLYEIAARCRSTKDFIWRVNFLAMRRTDFGAILYAGITYELERLFNIAPFHSRSRTKIEKEIFDEIELEVYTPQLGVLAEPLRKMWDDGPSSIATLEIMDEELEILKDNYWVYTTNLGDRELHYLTPTLILGDLIWAGFDYLSKKNPSPDIINVDFIKLLKESILDRIFEMEKLPLRLFMLGVPQKIKFLDCLFEEEVLKVKNASGPYPIVESELLNPDVTRGIAYLIRSFRNEVCIKSIFITNLAIRYRVREKEFFRGFYWFKKRRELRKSVLCTSGLETFLVLSTLSPVHILAFFNELDERFKELFLQIQLDKIIYRYPDLINALPIQEIIEKLPSGYSKRFEETFKRIALGNKEQVK